MVASDESTPRRGPRWGAWLLVMAGIAACVGDVAAQSVGASADMGVREWRDEDPRKHPPLSTCEGGRFSALRESRADAAVEGEQREPQLDGMWGYKSRLLALGAERTGTPGVVKRATMIRLDPASLGGDAKDARQS